MARGKDRYPPCPWKGHFNQYGKYNAHKSRSVFVVCFFLIFFGHVSLLYLASCTCCAFLCPILPSVLVSSLFRSLNSLFLFEFESACCVAYTARWWHSSLKLLFCIVLGFFLVLFQVKLLFFAKSREIVGKKEVDIEFESCTTSRAILESLIEEYPQ